MDYNALNKILVLIGMLILILVLMVRCPQMEKFEDGEFTKGEEDLYKRISEGLNDKTGQMEGISCADKTKFLDNNIVKKAYGANAPSDCYKIATEMCESTRPEMFKVKGELKAYKDTPLPTYTKLGCFDMHYGCCLQASSHIQND